MPYKDIEKRRKCNREAMSRRRKELKELEAKWKSEKKETAFDKPIRYKCPVCEEYTPCELYGTTPAPHNNPIYKCRQCGVLYGT